MVFVNRPFLGQDEHPFKKSVFVVTWNDDMLTPPPGSDYIVTEDSVIIAAENGDLFTTE